MPFDPKRVAKVNEVLGEPELYPPELLSWILKKLSDNPFFQVAMVQLPAVESEVEVGDPGAAEFVSPYENYTGGWYPAAYWRDLSNVVHVEGLVKTTSGILVDSTIFTLPAGFRPKYNKLTAQACSIGGGSDQHARVDFRSDGTVRYMGPTTGTISYLSINATFKAFS